MAALAHDLGLSGMENEILPRRVRLVNVYRGYQIVETGEGG